MERLQDITTNPSRGMFSRDDAAPRFAAGGKPPGSAPGEEPPAGELAFLARALARWESEGGRVAVEPEPSHDA